MDGLCRLPNDICSTTVPNRTFSSATHISFTLEPTIVPHSWSAIPSYEDPVDPIYPLDPIHSIDPIDHPIHPIDPVQLYGHPSTHADAGHVSTGYISALAILGMVVTFGVCWMCVALSSKHIQAGVLALLYSPTQLLRNAFPGNSVTPSDATASTSASTHTSTLYSGHIDSETPAAQVHIPCPHVPCTPSHTHVHAQVVSSSRPLSLKAKLLRPVSVSLHIPHIPFVSYSRAPAYQPEDAYDIVLPGTYAQED